MKLTDNNNIRNAVRIAGSVAVRDEERGRRMLVVLIHESSPRDVAREVFKQARATRRAHKAERD